MLIFMRSSWTLYCNAVVEYVSMWTFLSPVVEALLPDNHQLLTQMLLLPAAELVSSQPHASGPLQPLIADFSLLSDAGRTKD